MGATSALVNRESRMSGEKAEDRRTAAMRRVSALVSEALDLLDAHGGPVDAAAHLALALQIVEETPPTR